MRYQPFHLLLLLTLTAIGGCAGAVAETRMAVSGPFLASDIPLFDDGVDFVADPSHLQGSWLGDFRERLLQRIERADAIAVVRVDAVGEGVDLTGGKTHLLSVTVEQVLKGQLADQVTLASEARSSGFGTLDRAQSRLLHARFTVFVRWYERAEDLVAAHFHLSPATNEVLDVVSHQLR